MKATVFASRVGKELVRDPLTLFFGIIFPLILLGLLTAIQANIPMSLFEIDSLTPGISVFGLSFITLFSAMIVSRDRETSFLQRLYTAPLRASDFIFGYTMPFLLVSLSQAVVCYLAAIAMGLHIRLSIISSVLVQVPLSLFFIAFGLFCGSVLNTKAVGGICGALFSNLAGWLSGIWFDMSLVGGWFEAIANALPFIHAVEIEKAVLSGAFDGIGIHVLVVSLYSVGAVALAIIFFLRQMKKQ